MTRVRRGFTLIEVSLFLVITAAVFVGIAIGTQSSLFQQRYNDAVQNYVEFLRTVYSQVVNVQSEGLGRSNKAIYGKLVTFNNSDGKNSIKTYNVVGDIGDDETSCVATSILGKLGTCLNANVIIKTNDSGNITYTPVGFVDDYVPRWSSRIQTTAAYEDGYQLFTGALLIVRSPSTGTVYTYVTDKTIDVDAAIKNGIENPFIYSDVNYFTDGSFTQKDVDFCVNPNGAEKSNLRRDVRIAKKARNASGIEIISDEVNWINDNTVNIGNRCEK